MKNKSPSTSHYINKQWCAIHKSTLNRIGDPGAELAVIEVVIEALRRKKSLVRTLFDDPALIHHQYDIGVTDR